MADENFVVLGVKDCKISRVVVYRDRAEVTRIVEVQSPIVGELSIIVAGITAIAQLDAVCVRPVAPVTYDILEVSHENVTIPKPKPVESSASANSAATPMDADESVTAPIYANIAQEEDELALLKKKKDRFEPSLQLTKSFSDQVVDGGKDKDGKPMSIDYVQSVLEFRFRETERLDLEIFKVNKEIQEKHEVIRNLRSELNRKTSVDEPKAVTISPTPKYSPELKKISITVDVKDNANPLMLTFSYIVPNASWVPTYDIRVNTLENENVLVLSYFAEVTQSSGEDWADCELQLSTSNPAISADPPSIRPKTIDFDRPYYIESSYAKKSKGGPSKKTSSSYYDHDSDEERGLCRNASFAALEDMGGFPGQQERLGAFTMTQNQQDVFRKAEVAGTGDAGSTVFTITRKVKIASDSKPHKVMITAQRFIPQIVHYTVPSVSAYVYIQAKAKNTSIYPLLTSSKVNIYLDGNFISKSTFQQANRGETFQFFIGVDPAVKVEYLPTRTEEYKKGWMAGGNEVKKIHHKTLLHNTKSTNCRIIVVDTLPTTTIDKISVEIMEPSPSSILTDKSQATFTNATEAITNLNLMNEDVSDQASVSSAAVEEKWPNDFVTKNKANNNMIWFKTIKAGEKIEIPFSYRISWPSGNNVYIHEK